MPDTVSVELHPTSSGDPSPFNTTAAALNFCTYSKRLAGITPFSRQLNQLASSCDLVRETESSSTDSSGLTSLLSLIVALFFFETLPGRRVSTDPERCQSIGASSADFFRLVASVGAVESCPARKRCKSESRLANWRLWLWSEYGKTWTIMAELLSPTGGAAIRPIPLARVVLAVLALRLLGMEAHSTPLSGVHAPIVCDIVHAR